MTSSSAYPDLERAPGKSDNWVEKAGGLPSYIERIAKHLHYEKGKEVGTAIAIAVNTVKRWASGTNHNGSKLKPATVAKAQAAVAEWEAKKAKSHVKEAALDPKLQLDAAERVSLVGVLGHRASLVEGMAMGLRGKGTKNRAARVASARDLLEGRRSKLTLGGGNADPRDLSRVQSKLGVELSELRVCLEALGAAPVIPRQVAGPPAPRRGKGRAPAAKGRNGQAVFEESKHPRASAGRTGGGQFIRAGSSGPEVKGLQRRLGIKADGQFGPKTKDAVESFQGKQGLDVDGVVGAQTAGALRGTKAMPGPLLGHHRSSLRKAKERFTPAATAAADAAEKAKGQAKKAREEAKSSSSSSSSSSTSTEGGAGSTFGEGSSLPPKVAELIQRKLGVSTTGSYDDTTKERVEEFQKNHGLEVDGIVGTQTLAALRGDDSPPAPGAFTEGDWNWLSSNQAGGQREKRHEKQAGAQTERAREKEHNRLERERKREQRVQEAMQQDDFHRRYGAGMTGEPDEATGHLQRRLTELGYDSGADDGRYGEKTKGAVEAFQGDHDLKSDGEVGSSTKVALRGTDPEEVAKRRVAATEPKKTEDGEAPTGEEDKEVEVGEDHGDESEGMSLAGTVLTKGAGVSDEDPDPAVEQMQMVVGAEPDGRFGPDTEKKLKSTQRKYGLKADGVVGPKTGRLLDRMASKEKPKEGKEEQAKLDEAILDRMAAFAAGDTIAFTRARGREAALREAFLRDFASSALRDFYRLDDGTFAPKGRGQILKPGEEIHLPHRSGEGKVSAKVEHGSGGRGLARITSGPDSGQLAGIRTAAPQGSKARSFPDRPRRRADLPPGNPDKASHVAEVKAQNYLDHVNHGIDAGDDGAVQDYLDDMASDRAWADKQGYGEAMRNYDLAKERGEHFLRTGEAPGASDEAAQMDSAFDEAMADPQRAPIDFQGSSDSELSDLAANALDAHGLPKSGRDKSIFQAAMQERKRRALNAYRQARSDAAKSAMADVVAQITGRRPEGAPPAPQYAPPEHYIPNSGEKQLKDMQPGDTFYVGKHDEAYTFHRAVNDPFIVAKPVDGGKAKPFHKEFAPPFIGEQPGSEGAPAAASPAAAASDDLYDALKSSLDSVSPPPAIAGGNSPASPARSGKGNLRNFKAMSDEKLMSLALDMKNYPDDIEAVKAITAELKTRTGKPEPAPEPAAPATPNLPKTHEPAKNKSAEEKIAAAWSAYDKKKAAFDGLPPETDKKTKSKAAAQLRAAKFRIKRVGGDPDKPPTADDGPVVVKAAGPKSKGHPIPPPPPSAADFDPPPPPAPDSMEVAQAAEDAAQLEHDEIVTDNLNVAGALMGEDPEWSANDIAAALDKLETSGIVFDRAQESPDTLAAVIKAAGLDPAKLKTEGTTS